MRPERAVAAVLVIGLLAAAVALQVVIIRDCGWWPVLLNTKVAEWMWFTGQCR